MKQQLTIQGKLNDVQHQKELLQLMNLFGNSKRYAFNRIIKNNLTETRDIVKLEKDCYQKFIPNIRFSKDSVARALWMIKSKKETLLLNKEMLQDRIYNLNNKLERINSNNHKKHLIKNKLEKYNNKLKKVNYLIENDKLGKIVFGGRKSYEDLKEGKIDKVEWKLKRNNELYSRGDITKKGNPNFRIVGNQLRITNPITKEKYFENLYVPEKKLKYLNLKKYSILIKYVNGIFQVHITSDIAKKPTYTLSNGSIGVDINPKTLNASIVSKQGNYLGSREFNISDVLNTSKNKTKNILGNNVKKIVQLAKWQHKGIVIEDLSFKDKLGSTRQNRLFKHFTYSKIIELFKTQCMKEGVELKLVNPALTSFIGLTKYSQKYNMNIHNASAFVIGRRGLCFNEKIPSFYKTLVKPMEGRNKSWKQWSSLKKKLTTLEIKSIYDLHKLKTVSNVGGTPTLEIAISGRNRTLERGFKVA